MVTVLSLIGAVGLVSYFFGAYPLVCIGGVAVVVRVLITSQQARQSGIKFSLVPTFLIGCAGTIWAALTDAPLWLHVAMALCVGNTLTFIFSVASSFNSKR